jgi:hypothetical protein
MKPNGVNFLKAERWLARELVRARILANILARTTPPQTGRTQRHVCYTKQQLIRTLGWIAYIAVSLAQFSQANAGVIPLPPKDANLFVQQEVMVEALGQVGQLIGEDSRPIPWSGTIRDDGWTLSTFSPYKNGTLFLSYSGSLDPVSDIATWSGSGDYRVGDPEFGSSLTWNDSGSYTDATKDGFWNKVIKFVAHTVITGLTVAAAIGVVGAQVVSLTPPLTALGVAGLAGVSVSAVTGLALAGIAANAAVDKAFSESEKVATVKSKEALSSAAPPFESPFPIDAPDLLVTPNPNYPGITVLSDGIVQGDYADLSVSVTGTATIAAAAPEPGSLMLLGSGIVTLLGYAYLIRARARYDES